MKFFLLFCLAITPMAMAFPRTITESLKKGQGSNGFKMPGMTEGIGPNIVGGKEAVPHSFPHQVSVQYGYEDDWNHDCGGSIISESKIVTAAHCIYLWPRPRAQGIPELPDLLYRIVAGDHDLTVIEGTEQFVRIANYTFHPRYSIASGNLDYGVLHLAEPLKFNEYVQPIKLPAADYVPSGNCTTTGWGNTRADDSFEPADKLQEVTIPFVPRDECQLLWVDNPWNRKILESMICAGDDKKGPCNGDSGGPLVCNGVLAGIVSWGNQPCAQKAFPAVFANVAHGIDWINSN